MYYQWSDDLSVRVPSIDRQHKVLINLINELHEAMIHGKGEFESKLILNKLINYAKVHFIYEEGLFKGCHYHSSDDHIASHERIKAKLADLKEKSRQPGFELQDTLMEFLKTWLNNHILKEDMGYSNVMVENNIK